MPGFASIAALLVTLGLPPAIPRTAAEEGTRVLATTSVGAVTESDLAGWSRFVQIEAGATSRFADERKIEEIVILRELASRFEPGRYAGYDAALREAEARLAERALRELVLAGIQLEESELRREYEARRESLRQAPRWRLADIYKAAPADPDARERVRVQLDALRERVASGEDFAVIAKAESDSSTRLRGGADGFVELSRLRPELARVVEKMQPGDLSPVIELPNGFVLLRCGGAWPGADPTFEETRDRIANRVRGERFEAEWAQITARGAAVPARPTEEERRVAVRRELERRSWSPSPDDRVWLDWKELSIRAQFVADAIADAGESPPTPDEIVRLWREAPERWTEPRKRLLSSLTLRLRTDTPIEAVDGMRRLADELAAGRGRLDEAARALGSEAQLEDLGWLSDVEVWQLGLNAEAAIRELSEGEVSPVVQEGARLILFRLHKEQSERPLTLEEARPAILGALRARWRRAAADEIRASILADAAIRKIAP